MTKEILFCKHKERHWRMVSWAIDYKGKHEQGFRWHRLCKKCGKVCDD